MSFYLAITTIYLLYFNFTIKHNFLGGGRGNKFVLNNTLLETR